MIFFLTVFVVWLCSFGGIIYIVTKKLPQLKEVVAHQDNVTWKDVMKAWFVSLQRSSVAQNNHPEKLLHRILSKTRIFMLRSERVVGTWLERLRTRTQEKNGKKVPQKPKSFSEDYWGRLRKKKKEEK
ncbi:MAG: hypothetical protein HY458_00790 [Parcubacteria group bacterium]|nr:hypothetical protein [Parcubacteria group bacterium]